MISLTRRITIGSVLLTVAAVGLATASAWMAARWQAQRVLEGEVREHAGRLAGMLAHPRPPEDAPGPPPGDRFSPPELRAGTGWVLVAAADADGRELFRSPSLDGPAAGLLALVPAAADVRPCEVQWNGRPLLALAVRAEGEDGSPLRGVVAVDTRPTRAELGRLGLALLAVWATASLLALLSAWWLRRAVIGPLRALGRGIGAIDPERLDRRVPEDGPQEVAEATRLLNELLGRLERLVEREKGTIANIAHELRTPISGLRTTLEVAALDAGSPGAALARRCLPTVAAMHGLVGNLLALARLEAGHEQVRRRPVAVAAVLASCWAVVEPLARERGVSLDAAAAAGTADTCPERLAMVLGNLLANAVEHAPSGSAVAAVCSAGGGGRLRLRLANRFAGPAPDPQRVFEPFWRGDAARSSTSHCGLGLPLARRLAALLGGRLTVAVEDGTFAAELDLPAAG